MAMDFCSIYFIPFAFKGRYLNRSSTLSPAARLNSLKVCPVSYKYPNELRKILFTKQESTISMRAKYN